VRFHAAGKVSLDHLYVQVDPRTYFGTLRDLDYRIPGLAKPHFAGLIEEFRLTHEVDQVTVLDIGCSYGINPSLLRCDLTMDELYERYGAMDDGASRDTVLAADRALVRSRTRPDAPRFLGLDISADALSYAVAAGFLDDAVHADLEHDDPTVEQRDQLATADIVISTGCIGYVTERTLARVVQAGDARPWMAHTVLRMYRFEPVAQCLAELGYETVRVDGFLRQRRFASPEEQSQVLGTLSDLGVDPKGLEDDGWMYAQLFISRPRSV
jgi:SAM-dependent methyltransferase